MSQWLNKNERGANWTMQLMIALCRRRYRWLVGLLLYPIVAYFFITGRAAHRASRHFYTRVKGHGSWADYYRQLLNFSRCLVDRVTILTGEAEQFDIQSEGREELLQVSHSGQGLIMLGSHLGSFEACKLLARDRMDITIHIVAYFAGSTKVRQALDNINPDLQTHFIDPTEEGAIFKMRDVIDAGGILAILGDRTGIGEKKVRVDFLGKEADLPSGPYYLAAILKCPLFCFFGVRTGDYAYHTYAIKLADRLELVRGQRQQQVQQYAQQYADLLAEKARAYPDNWFNFYEFWQPPSVKE